MKAEEKCCSRENNAGNNVTTKLILNLLQHVCIVMNFIRYLALKNHGFAVNNTDLGVIVYMQA